MYRCTGLDVRMDRNSSPCSTGYCSLWGSWLMGQTKIGGQTDIPFNRQSDSESDKKDKLHIGRQTKIDG